MNRVLATAAVVVVALASAASAHPAVTFVFRGNGWGHGIGMSQYGAQGYAQHGKTYDAILAHYYPGTKLGTRSATIRVLLTSSRASLTIGSDASFTGGGTSFGAGTWRVTTGASGKLKLVKGSTTKSVASDSTFRKGSEWLEVDGARYRGTVVLRRSGSTVWALNVLGLNDYVRGVVPREMPAAWLLEALKAQAVAARTYALAAGGHCNWFGLSVMCRDISDQVYGGFDGEAASTNKAVSATSQKVLLYKGAPASTFFFSTSGGKTASVADEWGSAPIAYLVSVSDPYDSISPHHRWGPLDAETDCAGGSPDCVWRGSALKKRLGSRAPSGLKDMTVTRNGSSRVASVKAIGSAGNKTITGATMRAVLGLRSTWFTVGVLRVTSSASKIEKGQATKLSVLARYVGGSKLQKKRGSGPWEDMRKVSGNQTLTVRPAVTTSFRITSPSGSTSPVKVAVKPQLRFAQKQRAGSLLGTMNPSLAGKVVKVQRRSGGSWRTKATTAVRTDGTWRAGFEVGSGVYRAYAPPSHGYAGGVSPRLTIVAG